MNLAICPPIYTSHCFQDSYWLIESVFRPRLGTSGIPKFLMHITIHTASSRHFKVCITNPYGKMVPLMPTSGVFPFRAERKCVLQTGSWDEIYQSVLNCPWKSNNRSVNSLFFMEPMGSLPCIQKPVIHTCREPDADFITPYI
jgi:hypothetical protein